MQKYLAFLFLTFFSTSLWALGNEDHKAINQIIEHFAEAWNEHEGVGFADHYTPDADFVNIFGMTFAGKQEIEVRHIKILKNIFKGSLFEVTDTRLREASPGVVIALVSWKVTHIQTPGKDSFGESINGIFTHVILKNDNTWQITATQNTLRSSFNRN